MSDQSSRKAGARPGRDATDSNGETEDAFNSFNDATDLEEKVDEFLRRRKENGRPVDVLKLHSGIKKATKTALEKYDLSLLKTCLRIINTVCSNSTDPKPYGNLVSDSLQHVVRVIVGKNGISTPLEEEILLGSLETIILIGDVPEGGLREVVKCIPDCLRLAADENRQTAVRLEATKFLNSALPKYRDDAGNIMETDLVKYFDDLILHAGDLELQLCLTELLFRILVNATEREKQADEWFIGCSDFRQDLLAIHDNNFESDCRNFLNKLNASQADDERLVYSVLCKEVYVGTIKISCAMDNESKSFWTDFNLGSQAMKFFACDTSDGDSWETVTIKAEQVTECRMSEKRGEFVLILTMQEDIISSLISFCPEPDASYIKFIYDGNCNAAQAVKLLFKKQVVLTQETAPSPDVISCTPPKASVAINSVHFTSDSEGNREAKVLETPPVDKKASGKRKSPAKKIMNNVALENNGVKDKRRKPAHSNGSTIEQQERTEPAKPQEITESLMVTDDSGFAQGNDTTCAKEQSKVSQEDWGTDMDSDCVIVDGTAAVSGKSGDNQGPTKDKEETDVVMETQSVAESQEVAEPAVDEIAVPEKKQLPPVVTAETKDAKDSEGEQGMLSKTAKIKKPAAKKPVRARKPRAPKAKPATGGAGVKKDSKAKKTVSSTSESEQTQRKKASPKRRSQRNKPRKPTVRQSKSTTETNQKSKEKSTPDDQPKPKPETGYNTEDWCLGESDIERRKERRRLLEEARGEGRLTDCRKNLINNVFRDTQRYSAPSRKNFGPFYFKCSPLPKRSKQGALLLNPSRQQYNKRKEAEEKRPSLKQAANKEKASFSDVVEEASKRSEKHPRFCDDEDEGSERSPSLKDNEEHEETIETPSAMNDILETPEASIPASPDDNDKPVAGNMKDKITDSEKITAVMATESFNGHFDNNTPPVGEETTKSPVLDNDVDEGIAEREKDAESSDNDELNDDVIQGFRANLAKILDESIIRNEPSPSPVVVKKQQKPQPRNATPRMNDDTPVKDKTNSLQDDVETTPLKTQAITIKHKTNDLQDSDEEEQDEGRFNEINKKNKKKQLTKKPSNITTPKNEISHQKDSGFVDQSLSSTGGRKRSNESCASGNTSGGGKRQRHFPSLEGLSYTETPRNSLSKHREDRRIKGNSTSTKRKDEFKIDDEDIGFVSGAFTTYPERRRKKVAIHKGYDEEMTDLAEDERPRAVDSSDSTTPITMDDELSLMEPRRLFNSVEGSLQDKRKRRARARHNVDYEDDEDDDERAQDCVAQITNSIVRKSRDILEKHQFKWDSFFHDYMGQVDKCAQDMFDVEQKAKAQIKKLEVDRERCLRQFSKTKKIFLQQYEALREDSTKQQESLKRHTASEMLRYRDQITKHALKQKVDDIRRKIQAMIKSTL